MNIEKMIIEFVEVYSEKNNSKTRWKEPIVKVANAHDLRFNALKKSVRETHLLPTDLLSDGNSVITYFLPFDESVAKSNESDYYASEEWAVAYIETNILIGEINNYLEEQFRLNAYNMKSVAATHNFDEESLMSDWSHRHIAEIAGLGKLGLNNMLITDKGCCGRIGSLVTSAILVYDEEYTRATCLYYKNGTCGVCVTKCPQKAFENEYNRFKCYELLLDNDAHHTTLGLVDVCGKCCVALPCSYKDPC